VGAELGDYEERLAEGVQMAADADATVPIDGDSRKAEDRLSTLEEIVEASTPSIKMDAEDDLAQGVRLGFLEDARNSTGVVNLSANAWDAYSILRGFL